MRYIAAFLPHLAEHTRVLNPLTSKEAETNWPGWSMDHQMAFDRIKALVCSRECLIVVDRDALEDNSIFVSCDASDLRTGAMLSLGPSLETARPVTFESPPLVGAELRYPTHEKELLAIVRALKKWRVDLLGVPFTVYTDHRTLENFNRQKTSRVVNPGGNNSLANATSTSNTSRARRTLSQTRSLALTSLSLTPPPVPLSLPFERSPVQYATAPTRLHHGYVQ